MQLPNSCQVSSINLKTRHFQHSECIKYCSLFLASVKNTLPPPLPLSLSRFLGLSARYKGKYETGGIVPIIIVDDTERG
jgi:hypothetical protein